MTMSRAKVAGNVFLGTLGAAASAAQFTPYSWGVKIGVLLLCAGTAGVVWFAQRGGKRLAQGAADESLDDKRSSQIVYPGRSSGRTEWVANLLAQIDRSQYRTADTFDTEELRTLLQRFPDAIMLLREPNALAEEARYTGYLSAFPISLDTASRLETRPADDFALPCTSRD